MKMEEPRAMELPSESAMDDLSVRIQNAKHEQDINALQRELCSIKSKLCCKVSFPNTSD